MRTSAEPIEKVSTAGRLARPVKTCDLRPSGRAWMASCLFCADLVSLTAAGALAVLLESAVGGGFQPLEGSLRLVALLLVCPGIYAWSGLYPAAGLSAAEELRRLTTSTSLACLLTSAFSFWPRSAGSSARLALPLAWLLAPVLVQLGRWLVRCAAIRRQAWGEPVAIIGYGPQGRRVVEFLLGHARFGFRPAVILDGTEGGKDGPAPIPRVACGDRLPAGIPPELAGIQTAIVINAETTGAWQETLLQTQGPGFRRLILISNLSGISRFGMVPYDLEGLVGLEVRQNLPTAWERRLKRLVDLVLALAGGLVVLPLALAVALMIRADSPGGVLYGHRRIGRGGREIQVWKFRTMVKEAEAALAATLAESPAARREWETTRKLKADPRVTRLGRLLRRTSLDELPQLWNVLKGEMSLVGPRPIVAEEIRHYREGFQLYTQVQPGLTGLWQVSGRNNLDYAERVRLDEYYIRNWSVWLDIEILLQTVWALLRGEGAY